MQNYEIACLEEKIISFHGCLAPGVLLGGFMVDLAYSQLPGEGLYDAICETSRCLPDAIQILTPCTIGNGWLRIIDSGRYALTLYNKMSGEGIRIHIPMPNLDQWPAIKEWFLKLTSKKEQDYDRLIEDIKSAGSTICAYQKVRVTLPLPPRHRQSKQTICPQCNESHFPEGGVICQGCRGELPFYSIQSGVKIN